MNILWKLPSDLFIYSAFNIIILYLQGLGPDNSEINEDMVSALEWPMFGKEERPVRSHKGNLMWLLPQGLSALVSNLQLWHSSAVFCLYQRWDPPSRQWWVFMFPAGLKGLSGSTYSGGPTSSLDWRGQAHLQAVGSQILGLQTLWPEFPFTASGFGIALTSSLLDACSISGHSDVTLPAWSMWVLFCVLSLPPYFFFLFQTLFSLINFVLPRFAFYKLLWFFVAWDSVLYPFWFPEPSSVHRNLYVPRSLSIPHDCFRHHL